MADRQRVLISGAGIAGLAAAACLRQIGWVPMLVEQAPAPRGGGFLVNFADPGYGAAERMGILPALRERHVDLTDLVYVDHTGRTRYTLPLATVQAMLGERHVTLLRGDIEAVLLAAVRDSTEIRFGTRIEQVVQDGAGVHAVLSDGTRHDADLLIGADGLHSTVRGLVFGPEDRFRVDLGNLVVAALPLAGLPVGAHEGAATVLTTPGRTLAIAGLEPGRAAAFFTYRSADPVQDLAGTPQEVLAKAYSDLGWAAVPDLLSRLADHDAVHFDSVSQVVTTRWSRGTVVLLGDAAWCPSLFAGAGSSLAVAGAVRLSAALERRPRDVPAALAVWETEMRPEVARRQRTGRRNALRHAPSSPLRAWMRDAVLRAAGLRVVAPVLARHLRLH